MVARPAPTLTKPLLGGTMWRRRRGEMREAARSRVLGEWQREVDNHAGGEGLGYPVGVPGWGPATDEDAYVRGYVDPGDTDDRAAWM